MQRGMQSQRLSKYAEKLSAEPRVRYMEKIQLIGNTDPFTLSGENLSSGIESSNLPPVDASDLVSYLVLQTSFVTAKQFKAHKSLEAYNQFTSGWVKDIRSWEGCYNCM